MRLSKHATGARTMGLGSHICSVIRQGRLPMLARQAQSAPGKFCHSLQAHSLYAWAPWIIEKTLDGPMHQFTTLQG